MPVATGYDPVAQTFHWLTAGLLMSQGAGRPTSLFGLFDVPQMLALGPHDQATCKLGKFLYGQVLNWIF